MNLQLQGKTALITGATSGIGFAIAHALAAEGASIIINGRTDETVNKAKSRILSDFPQAHIQGIAADLSSAEGMKALLNKAPEVDMLINNLGIFDFKPFEQIDDDEWLHFFQVNVLSGVRLARHHLSRMKQRNWGRIIFISSESGICPPAEMVHYGMTKSAQLSISRSLAESCTGTGVTVNAVLPGPTRTEGAEAAFARIAAESGKSLAETETDFFAQARPTSILKRFIDPKEVASLVAYICSPLSAATQGAALRVDGGVVRSII
jgi:NAD(P)-dependent dehydrogenase (short-subunit alcohol dehydrogenase family)